MTESIADLARRLARHAEAVCRHYLSNGRCQGRYWIVGDLANSPGRSLYVRLHGPDSGKGAAGKWTDAATGEHGDLLDLIAGACRLIDPREALQEARRFLSLPHFELPERHRHIPSGSPEAARRLFAMARPIHGTIAGAYLRHRGITYLQNLSALRFHARCYYRADDTAPHETRPALLAAVTDTNGTVTGVHRTWLAPDGTGKAPIATPRRAMGNLLGNGVCFGTARDVVAAGEGIETALPRLPMIAALSANHLAALALPSGLRRLYIARDNDRAGLRAAETLRVRAEASGIQTLTLTPIAEDFNGDLRMFGRKALACSLRSQLAPEDVERFLRRLAAAPRSGCPAVSSAEPVRVRPRRNRRCAAAFERAIGPEAARPRNGGAAFPDASRPRQIRAEIATNAGHFSHESTTAPRRPPLCCGPSAAPAGAGPRRSGGVIATKAACRAANPSEDFTHDEPLLP